MAELNAYLLNKWLGCKLLFLVIIGYFLDRRRQWISVDRPELWFRGDHSSYSGSDFSSWMNSLPLASSLWNRWGIRDLHHRVLRAAVLKLKPGSVRVCCGLWLPQAYSWISRSGLTAGKTLDMQKVRPPCLASIWPGFTEHSSITFWVTVSAATNQRLFLSFPKCRVQVSQTAWWVKPTVGVGSIELGRRETKFTGLTSDLYTCTVAHLGFPIAHPHNKQTNKII